MTGSHHLEGFIKVVSDGREHEIDDEVYRHFFKALPPVISQSTNYQGKSWDFGFAEGYDRVILFRQEDDKYFARQTPWKNPRIVGDIDSQKKSFLVEWLRIAKKERWSRDDVDPSLTTKSFQEVGSDAELIDKLKQGNWQLGQGLFVGDLCFIKRHLHPDQWLAIKDTTVLSTIPFRHIISSHDKHSAQEIIDTLRAASASDIITAKTTVNHGR